MSREEHRRTEGNISRAAVKDLLVGAAKEFLENDGSYPPFGASMNLEGELAIVGTYLHSQVGISPLDHVDTLLQGFVAQRGGLRAFGICSDVNPLSGGSSEATGAIQVNVESSDGVAEVFRQSFVIAESFCLLEGVSEESVPLVFLPRRKWWWPWSAT